MISRINLSISSSRNPGSGAMNLVVLDDS